MTTLARVREGISYGDLYHLERPEQIAVYLVESAAGLILVDPGPESCREALVQALSAAGASLRDVRHLLLTHIHLDHAGIAGSLAQADPRIKVYVHNAGAKHLVDPTRLLESARRIYTDQMERLWGKLLPVPRDQLIVLDGGERLTLGARKLLVGATPGHAIHHVAYLDENEGAVFTGDVAGEATQHRTPALPVSPPPDIDPPTWRESLSLVESWAPELLLATHYGPIREPQRHIDELWARLVEWSELVRETLDEPGTDDERADRFADREMERLCDGLSTERAAHVERNSVHTSWYGLARYWRRKANAVPPASA